MTSHNAIAKVAVLLAISSLTMSLAGCSALGAQASDSYAPTGSSSGASASVSSTSEPVPTDASSATPAATATAAVSADTAAATDTAADNSSGFGNDATSGITASSDTYSGNPTVKLPSTIDDSVSDDDTMVAGSYAQKDDGTVVDVTTGEEITDPDVVGTSDAPADPLAKTDGESFIPVSVGTIRSEIESDDSSGSSDVGTGSGSTDSADTGSTDKASASTVNNASATANSAGSSDSAAASVSSATFMSKNSADSISSAEQTQPSVTQASLQNMYGAYWGTYNGTSAFYSKGGSLFAQQAKGVVDVSQWQGTINWTKAKAAGVQGAIIRIGYGQGHWDTTAKRNISECKRLGIPFGIYLYSYAYSSAFAKTEGADLAKMLKSIGITGKTSYPIYYDLEAWSWTGHAHPTSPSVYNGIVNSWYSTMKAAGYTNLGVYSYTSYLSTALNNSNIYAKTSWVAEYGPKMNFTKFGSNARGWQYSSSGSVSGISGNVDINAFGNKTYVSSTDITKLGKLNIPSGKYYINTGVKDTSSVDIPSGKATIRLKPQVYQWNNTKAQQFQFTRQSDGSYIIKNISSGMVLEVQGNKASNGGVIQQYTANGSTGQRWFIRESNSGGFYLQSALGNWCLDIASGKSSNGTKIQLYAPNGTRAQLFGLASVVSVAQSTDMQISAAADSSKVVDIKAGSKANNAPVQLYTANGTSAQNFKFKQVGNGVFTLQNSRSGKMLDVNGNKIANKAAVGQYQSNGSTAQHWMIRVQSNGLYTIIGSYSGKALDIPSGKAVNGAALRIYALNNSSAQNFRITQVSSLRASLTALATKHKSDIKNGMYTIAFSSSALHVLDVKNGSTANSANVRMYGTNATDAQKWKVTHDANGYVSFTNVKSGKVLDVHNADASNGSNVAQYSSNGSYAQKWIVAKNSNGYSIQSAVVAGAYLSVSSTVIKNGINVQVGSSPSVTGYRWKFTTSSTTRVSLDALAAKNRSVISNGTYVIKAFGNSRYAIDLAGGSHSNGANVRIYSLNGAKAQKWTVSHDKAGYITFTSKESGKVLDVHNGAATLRANVDQYAANSTYAQKWIAVRNSDGSYKVMSALGENLVLDIKGSAYVQRTNIQLFTSNGAKCQKWIFTRS